MLLSDHRTKGIKLGSLLALPAIFIFALLAERYFPKPPPTDIPPPFKFPAPVTGFFMAVTVGIWGTIIFTGWKIKTVRVVEGNLRIGGWREEIDVPLHQVGEVDQPLPVGRLARLALHEDTRFGDTIWFLPIGAREGLFGPFRGVSELRAIVAGARGDRSVLPPPPVDYAEAWRGYRRLRRINLLSPPAMFIAFAVMEWNFPRSPLVLPLIFLFMLPWMITGTLLQRWPCPRCGQQFFGTWANLLPNIFIRRCNNCGLPKGETDPGASGTAGR